MKQRVIRKVIILTFKLFIAFLLVYQGYRVSFLFNYSDTKRFVDSDGTALSSDNMDYTVDQINAKLNTI